MLRWRRVSVMFKEGLRRRRKDKLEMSHLRLLNPFNRTRFLLRGLACRRCRWLIQFYKLYALVTTRIAFSCNATATSLFIQIIFEGNLLLALSTIKANVAEYESVLPENVSKVFIFRFIVKRSLCWNKM